MQEGAGSMGSVWVSVEKDGWGRIRMGDRRARQLVPWRLSTRHVQISHASRFVLFPRPPHARRPHPTLAAADLGRAQRVVAEHLVGVGVGLGAEVRGARLGVGEPGGSGFRGSGFFSERRGRNGEERWLSAPHGSAVASGVAPPHGMEPHGARCSAGGAGQGHCTAAQRHLSAHGLAGAGRVPPASRRI